MNIQELDAYNLDDAVKFNDHLNPRIWGKDEHLRPEVRDQLLKIAEDFKESLGIKDLDLKDITISGSNAAYTYTPNSDIDLHLVVDQPEDPVYRELFDAKKFQYNETHNITIGGADVELYVEAADKPPVTQGMYSVLHNKWIQVPKRVKSNVNDTATRNKFETIGHQIEAAVKSQDLKKLDRMARKVKRMRQTGLEAHGEFGPENLAFKMLRSQGVLDKMHKARADAKSQALSLRERRKPGSVFTYGFKHEESVEPPVVENTVETPQLSDEQILNDFIQFCVAELKINQIPTIKLRKDPQWPVVHKTFGRYNDDRKMLEVAWGQRHIMDVLRTVAHELTHKHQHERDGERMGPEAGETGSKWENEANARAGILMRDYARLHPDFFDAGQAEELHIDEGVRSSAAAAAVVAALAGGPVTAQAQNILGAIRDIGSAVRQAQSITRAGLNDEVQQEIRNFIRAQGGDPGSQNLSHLYQLQRELQRQEPESGALPGYVQQANPTNESASGYIPTKRQAKDPRYIMALTQDVQPGAVGREANKLKLKTNSQGQPQVAQANGLFEQLMTEFNRYKEDYNPDAPPGPEFKPTMPRGTVRVDVSDMYDWYKLGKKISDLKSVKPGEFGKGPPSTIVSFGDENTEHKYIKDLSNIGLGVTDIDPKDPKQPQSMRRIKTDPTYNVDETIQAPINRDKDSEQYYRFIMAKHKLGRPLTRQEQEYVRTYQMFQRQQVAESEQLDEVSMRPSRLRQFANSPEAQGIQAGFEAELIFRDTINDDDGDEMEPDYDADERCRSISQIIDFFNDGEYGGLSQRQESRLQDGLDEQYMEWFDEQMYDAFRDEADDLVREIWLEDRPMSERIHAALVDGLDLSDEEADRIEAVGSKAPKFTSSHDQEVYAQENQDYETYIQAVELAEEVLDDDVEQSVSKQDGVYDQALDNFRDNFSTDDDSGFFDDVGLRWMSDVASEYDLDWPYMTGSSNGGSRDWENIADSLNQAVDMPVKVSSGYHSATRKPGLWIVEPDSSLQPDDREDYGLEIVSPPMPLKQALEKLQAVTDWANSNEGDAYTNESTGLHMGVSIPYKEGRVDYLKLILFLGDEYVLQQYGREANTYTKAAMKEIRSRAGSEANATRVLELLKHNLIELAERELVRSTGEGKYTSAHKQNKYIEFRSAGGDWLAEDNAEPGKLENTMMRYAYAMYLAGNPGLERKEYAKKLYKLVASGEDASTMALFSQYAAGELDKDQLKKRWAEKTLSKEAPSAIARGNWVVIDNNTGKIVLGHEYEGYTEDEVRARAKQKLSPASSDQDFDKAYSIHPKETGKWEVYRDDHGQEETLEIIDANRRGEAVDIAYDKYTGVIPFKVRAWYGDEPATPEKALSPRAKLAKRIVQPKQDPRGEGPHWQAVYKPTGRVIDTVSGLSPSQAAEWRQKVIRDHDFTSNPDDIVVRLDGPEQQRYRTWQAAQQAADQQNQEQEPAVAQNFSQSTNPNPTMHSPEQVRAPNGVPMWEVYQRDNGHVVHTFADHTQREAWAAAQAWLRSIGAEPSAFSEFSVRPKMNTVSENFADGKGPGRPGDSQRHGIPKGASIAQLEKAAKAPGRKGQLARWQLNMRRGKKK